MLALGVKGTLRRRSASLLEQGTRGSPVRMTTIAVCLAESPVRSTVQATYDHPHRLMSGQVLNNLRSPTVASSASPVALDLHAVADHPGQQL
jgi:hypothetical protein